MYQPSVNDVGSRICAEWHTEDGKYKSNFAQYGPIALDTEVKDKAMKKLNSKNEAEIPVRDAFGVSSSLSLILSLTPTRVYISDTTQKDDDGHNKEVLSIALDALKILFSDEDAAQFSLVDTEDFTSNTYSCSSYEERDAVMIVYRYLLKGGCGGGRGGVTSSSPSSPSSSIPIIEQQPPSPTMQFLKENGGGGGYGTTEEDEEEKERTSSGTTGNHHGEHEELKESEREEEDRGEEEKGKEKDEQKEREREKEKEKEKESKQKKEKKKKKKKTSTEEHNPFDDPDPWSETPSSSNSSPSLSPSHASSSASTTVQPATVTLPKPPPPSSPRPDYLPSASSSSTATSTSANVLKEKKGAQKGSLPLVALSISVSGLPQKDEINQNATSVKKQKELESKYETLKKRQKTQIEKLQSLAQTIEDLRTDNTELRAHVAMQKENIGNLASKRTEAEKKLKEREKENEKMKNELERERKRLQQTSVDTVSERKSYLSDMETLKATLRELSSQMSSISQSEAEAKAELEETKKEREKLEIEVTQLRSLKEQLESKGSDLSTHLSELTNSACKLGAEVDELKKQLKQSQTTGKEQYQELTELKVILEDRQQALARLQNADKERERMEVDLKRTENRLTEVTQEKTDLDELCAHLNEKAAESEASVRQLEGELHELEKELESLKDREKELKRSRESVSSLNLTLNEKDTKIASLEAALGCKEEEEREREKKYQETLTALKAEMEELKTRGDELVAQRNFFKRKSDSMAADIEKLLTSKSGPNAEIVGAIFGNKTSSSSDLGSSDVSRLTTRVQTLEEELKEMGGALEAYKSAFERQLAKSKRDHQQKLKLSSNSKQSSSSLQRQYDELRNLANLLSETISEKDEALFHRRHVNKMLGKRVKELEAMIERLEEQNAKLQMKAESHLHS